jgi:hypothetical protein
MAPVDKNDALRRALAQAQAAMPQSTIDAMRRAGLPQSTIDAMRKVSIPLDREAIERVAAKFRAGFVGEPVADRGPRNKIKTEARAGRGVGRPPRKKGIEAAALLMLTKEGRVLTEEEGRPKTKTALARKVEEKLGCGLSTAKEHAYPRWDKLIGQKPRPGKKIGQKPRPEKI